MACLTKISVIEVSNSGESLFKQPSVDIMSLSRLSGAIQLLLNIIELTMQAHEKPRVTPYHRSIIRMEAYKAFLLIAMPLP
jgi:hypothetical protein